MVVNGACAECLRIKRHANREKNYEAVKAWRAANPEKRAAQSKRYSEKYPEKKRQAVDKYRSNNIVEIRERNRLSQQRLRIVNPEAEKRRLQAFYERKEQKRVEEAGRPRPSKCEICNEQTNTSIHNKIVYDHCHVSGKFRGWICDRCNKVLGLAKDSPDLLLNLASYLENFNVQINNKTEEGVA